MRMKGEMRLEAGAEREAEAAGALIGIISDTHGTLRPEALATLEGVDHILHAGDIGRADIVPRLRKIAPVTAIRGNVDGADWARAFPPTAAIAFSRRRVFMIHDRKDLAFDPAAEGYAAVIAGHSHKPGAETVGGVLHLNPGSAGPRRFSLPVTLATLRLEGDTLAWDIRSIV